MDLDSISAQESLNNRRTFVRDLAANLLILQ